MIRYTENEMKTLLLRIRESSLPWKREKLLRSWFYKGWAFRSTLLDTKRSRQGTPPISNFNSSTERRVEPA